MVSVSECVVYPPETKVCGPGGLRCIQGNESIGSIAVCECAEGWTNFGDFALSPNGPCDMNILAIQVLWGTMGAANFCSFLFALLFLWRKYQDSFSNEKRKKMFDNPGVTVVYVGLSGFFFTITGTVRASAPLKFVLGGDLFTSFAYSLGVDFFFLAALVSFSNIVNTAHLNLRIKSQQTKMGSTKTLESIKQLLPIYYVVITILSFLPFILAIINVSLKKTGPFEICNQVLVGAAYVGIGFTVIFLGVFMVPKWLGTIVEDCESILNLEHNMPSGSTVPMLSERRNDRLKSMVEKFKFLRKEVRKLGALNGISAMVFGCWEYLTHKSSYILPLNFISAAGVGIMITWSVFNFSSGTSKTSPVESRFSSEKKNSKGQDQSKGSKVLDRIPSKLTVASGPIEVDSN